MFACPASKNGVVPTRVEVQFLNHWSRLQNRLTADVQLPPIPYLNAKVRQSILNSLVTVRVRSHIFYGDFEDPLYPLFSQPLEDASIWIQYCWPLDIGLG